MSNSSGGHEFNDDNHGTRPVSPSRLKTEIGPPWHGPVQMPQCSPTSLWAEMPRPRFRDARVTSENQPEVSG